MEVESRLLDAWEAAEGEAMPMRAVTLIRVFKPETPRETIAAWSLGCCHRHLIELRRALFGRAMGCRASCPECREALEFSLDATSFLAESDGSADEPLANSPYEMSVGDHLLVFRLPSPVDIEAASSCATVDEARRLLAARCIESIELHGAAVSGEIDDHLIDALSERMAEADPFADIHFATECPACAHRWNAQFDILGFLWREIERWARRILGDIHTLASAYGWSEREILSLAPGRRSRYLTMATQ